MTETADSVVLYQVIDGVACVTLNRPDRLNASNRDLSEGLTKAFSSAAEDPLVKVVLLRGAGRAFCAGADSKVLDTLSTGPGVAPSGSSRLRYDGLMLLPKPVIAAVHGPCAGIGLVLACCADIRLAADDAVFVAPFAQLGLCAEAGLAWLLQRLVGQGNAAEMLLSARRVGASEALAKGLVSQVLPAADFAEASLAYAHDLARGAPSSFAMMKRQLREAAVQDFESARTLSGELTGMTLTSEDFREAMTARREQRAPNFAPVSAVFEPPISQPRSAPD